MRKGEKTVGEDKKLRGGKDRGRDWKGVSGSPLILPFQTRFRKEEAKVLSDEIDYNLIKGLSNEHKQKLSKIKPSTLGQAQRIDGITPSAIGLILSHVKNTNGAKTGN